MRAAVLHGLKSVASEGAELWRSGAAVQGFVPPNLLLFKGQLCSFLAFFLAIHAFHKEKKVYSHKFKSSFLMQI